MNNKTSLPYDPGILPTKPPPARGKTINIDLEGLPPFEEKSRSLRNPSHHRYNSFIMLRNAVTQAMRKRAPYRGAVKLTLIVYASRLPKNRNILDYVGGIQNTLDGSHGPGFTYLPIVFEDDCQVASFEGRFVKSNEEKYHLEVAFL